MAFLYSAGIRIYGFILWIAQFFNAKAKSWIEGRKNFRAKLPDTGNREVYWFHCASLGEFDQGLPLMNRLKEENPGLFLLVTFFSPSGFEHYHKRKHSADFVCYLPLDTRSNANMFISHFKPSRVFFIKYEFWGNYIFTAKRHGAEVYSVSALFRENHRFFKWHGSYFRKILRRIDYFFVQDRSSLELLASIGIKNAVLCGDTRFDRVIENKQHATGDALIESFLKGNKAFIVGSSWPEDEELLESFILRESEYIPVIIAPHDISENHLQQIEKRFGDRIARYSRWEQNSGARILLIDSIGKLANAYRFGEIAYVGGGFSGSLHNILEPAVFGLPVIFGPKHKRFPEGQRFIDAGVGFAVSDSEELFRAWGYIRENRAGLSDAIEMLVAESTGATEKIVQFLKSRN